MRSNRTRKDMKEFRSSWTPFARRCCWTVVAVIMVAFMQTPVMIVSATPIAALLAKADAEEAAASVSEDEMIIAEMQPAVPEEPETSEVPVVTAGEASLSSESATPNTVLTEQTSVKFEFCEHYAVYDEGDSQWHEVPDIKWEAHLIDQAAEYEVEEFVPILVLQMYNESHFNPDAISSSGDYGLAQINQCNHSRLKKELGITDFLDPYQSIECQVYMMAPKIKDSGIQMALSVYNTGKLIEHCRYSDNIMSQYEKGYVKKRLVMVPIVEEPADTI